VAELHLTVEILRAFAQGTVSPRRLVEIGLEHLTSCPLCREGLRAWHEERTASEPIQLLLLPAVLDRYSRALKKKQVEADRDARELLRLPQPERLRKIDRSVHRFRGCALAASFLRQSRELMPTDPGEAYDLAEIAQAALRRTPTGPGVGELSALAAAYLGNSLRARGELRESSVRFDLARYLIQQERVVDPLVLAEVDLCEGVLALDQRQLQDAERLLTRSIFLFTIVGDSSRGAHPRLTLGHLCYVRGDLAKAIEHTREAAEAVPVREERLYLYAHHNLALYLCEAGRYTAAAEALRDLQDLYARFPDPFTQLRHLWLEAKILAGLGQQEGAERVFAQVRDGFLAERLGYDVALVSMDLALLYARQDRREELRRLAEEMHPIFAAEDIHREAMAALLLFQESARRDALTLDTIEDLAAYLRAARANPALRYERVDS
jgi:tetratricopeptide (TPR) repeat protein